MPRSLVKFREVSARLSNEPCAFPGCPKNRLGVAKYCQRHARRTYHYGHPAGLPVPRDHYRQELDEVAGLFKDNINHPGLLQVLKFLDGWIEEASKGEALVGNYVFGRIHIKRIQGVEGLSTLDLLTEIMAVWVFSHRYPSRLPDDQRLTFTLSRNLVRLATIEKRTYGKNKTTRHPPVVELRGVGERIRQTLALFHINVVASLRAKAEKAQASREAMSIPFE